AAAARWSPSAPPARTARAAPAARRTWYKALVRQCTSVCGADRTCRFMSRTSRACRSFCSRNRSANRCEQVHTHVAHTDQPARLVGAMLCGAVRADLSPQAVEVDEEVGERPAQPPLPTARALRPAARTTTTTTNTTTASVGAP